MTIIGVHGFLYNPVSTIEIFATGLILVSLTDDVRPAHIRHSYIIIAHRSEKCPAVLGNISVFWLDLKLRTRADVSGTL